MSTIDDGGRLKAERPISVLILAGGQSSRMGQDKALLSWQGIPLLTHICQCSQALSDHIQVLSPWPDRYANLLPKTVENRQELTPGLGPLWALNQGLNDCSGDWLLLLACDMPLLNAARLQQWRSQLVTLPSSCLAYVPQTQSKTKPQTALKSHVYWEPLCGFYQRSSQDALTQFLAQGGRSFQNWLNTIETQAIPLRAEDTTMMHNCNTPADWAMAKSLASPSPLLEETR